MSRKDERIQIMKLIYAMEIQENYAYSEHNFEILEIDKVSEYQKHLIKYFLDNKEEIDSILEKSLKTWTIDSLNKVDLAIIRLSATEIKYMKDIPDSVSINEAVEIAKEFGDDKSPKFINAILKYFL